jgi:hypothetical protein
LWAFSSQGFLIPYMELRVLGNDGMVLRAVRCSLRNLNSTETQRKHENHQGRPVLTIYSETQPKETYEQGEKKPPVHSTEEKLLIVAKNGPR